MAINPDMIGIVVRDMAAALRFYRTLGLDVPEGQQREPFVQVRLTRRGGRGPSKAGRRGLPQSQTAVGRVLGSALRDRGRPGRESRQHLRRTEMTQAGAAFSDPPQRLGLRLPPTRAPA